MRYRLLGQWARERGIGALLTAHHLDDQAETLLMRLARGAGVKGLAGMRPLSRPPGPAIAVVRPLLRWRHSELEAVCAAAGIAPVEDPSNTDEQFERVRVRKALAASDWLDPAALAQSAVHLAEADGALHWATDIEWQRGSAPRRARSSTSRPTRRARSAAGSSAAPSSRSPAKAAAPSRAAASSTRSSPRSAPESARRSAACSARAAPNGASQGARAPSLALRA